MTTFTDNTVGSLSPSRVIVVFPALEALTCITVTKALDLSPSRTSTTARLKAWYGVPQHRKRSTLIGIDRFEKKECLSVCLWCPSEWRMRYISKAIMLMQCWKIVKMKYLIGTKLTSLLESAQIILSLSKALTEIFCYSALCAHFENNCTSAPVTITEGRVVPLKDWLDVHLRGKNVHTLVSAFEQQIRYRQKSSTAHF